MICLALVESFTPVPLLLPLEVTVGKKCSGQGVLFLLKKCNGNFSVLRAGGVSLFSPAGCLFSLVHRIGNFRLMQCTASPCNLFCNTWFWCTRNNMGKGTLGTWTSMIAVLPMLGILLQAQSPNLMHLYENMYFYEKYLYTIKL